MGHISNILFYEIKLKVHVDLELYEKISTSYLNYFFKNTVE